MEILKQCRPTLVARFSQTWRPHAKQAAFRSVSVRRRFGRRSIGKGLPRVGHSGATGIFDDVGTRGATFQYGPELLRASATIIWRASGRTASSNNRDIAAKLAPPTPA